MVSLLNGAREKAQIAENIAKAANTTYICIESELPAVADRHRGDTWIDVTNGNIMKKWDGSNWIELSDAKAEAAMTQANYAFSASSGKNTISYLENLPDEAKRGDIWVKTSQNGYHNMYVCVSEHYQKLRPSDTDYRTEQYINEHISDFWVLTSAGKTYGTNIKVDPNAGLIDITAPSSLHMGTNGTLALDGGTVNIGGTNVNIAANSHLNIQSEGELVLGGGQIKLDGQNIAVGTGKLEVQGGTIRIAGGKLEVAADDIDIGSSDIGEEDWSKNLVFNSAANAMRYNYSTNSTTGEVTKTENWTQSGWYWTTSNSTLTCGKASDKMNALQPGNTFKNPFKNKKNVFHLHRTSGSDLAYASTVWNLHERITEPGEYTFQCRIFITDTQYNNLGTNSSGANIIVFFQNKPCNGDYAAWGQIRGFKTIASSSDKKEYKALKAGWNKIKRTVTITQAMIDSEVLRFYIGLSASSATTDILFTNIKLERGSTATGWTAAPEDEEENYQLGQNLSVTNWTKINQNADGITLQSNRIKKITGSDDPAYANQVQNGSVKLTPTQFNVSFNGRTAMNITPNETKINTDTLKVSGHITGDVVNKQSSATWDTNNHSSDTNTDNMQKWINSLGKYLTGNINIYIRKQLSGNIVLDGFKGTTAYINIIFYEDGYLFGTIYGRYCDHISIKSDLSSGTILPSRCAIAPVGKNTIGISMSAVNNFSCTRMVVDMSLLTNTDGKVAYRISDGTNATFEACNALGNNGTGSCYGWYAIYNANVYLNNCFGGDQISGGEYSFAYALYAYYGSSIYVVRKKPFNGYASYGATISVSSSAVETDYYGQTAGSSASPSFAYGHISNYSMLTITPRASNSRYGYSLRSISSSISNSNTSNMQERVDNRIISGPITLETQVGDVVSASTSYYYGIWFFGSGSNNVIKATTEVPFDQYVTASLMISRMPRTGSDNGNSVSVYWTTKETESTPSTSDTTTQSAYFNSSRLIGTVNVAMGDYVTLPLTGTHLTALKNGQIKGFCVASSSPMEFYPTGCELTVMREVP